MTVTKKISLYKLIGFPALVFAACIAVTLSAAFKEHPDRLVLPLLGDLLLTAPLAYYFAIHRTAVSRLTVLRVFMAGIVIAGLLLSKQNAPVFSLVKTWLSPLVELSLIGFIVRKFFKAAREVKAAGEAPQDFLTHCRTILTSVTGSEKLAHLFASEVAVFYYSFKGKDKGIDDRTRFTCYRQNGIVLVLSTLLCLFAIETAGMHFLFMLWSKTAAWVLTALSFYTCLQLFAHIKALRARPIVLINGTLLLRNGLMGGEAVVALTALEKAERITKTPGESGIVRLALLKGIEKPTVALYFRRPVTLVKAFGIRQTANVLLVSIDHPEAFLQALEAATGDSVS